MKENEEEMWLAIPGYEGLYEVSNWGRVRRIVGSKTKDGILKPHFNKGYCSSHLSKKSKGESIQTHQLVAMAFLGHKRCGMELVVDHINGIRSDNRVENLRIVTNRENISICHRKNVDNNHSEMVGVYRTRTKGVWRSQIMLNRRSISLGTFNKKQDAYRFYICANENIDRYENTIQFQKLLRSILQYEDGRIFDHEHVFFNKSRNRWVSGFVFNKVRIFYYSFNNREDATLCSRIAYENRNMFNGNKIEYRDMILDLFKKEKESV